MLRAPALPLRWRYFAFMLLLFSVFMKRYYGAPDAAADIDSARCFATIDAITLHYLASFLHFTLHFHIFIISFRRHSSFAADIDWLMPLTPAVSMLPPPRAIQRQRRLRAGAR